MEFEFLFDRPDDVPLVIDWWRTVWGDRMGDDIENAITQLRVSLSKTELPIHILATVDGQPVGTAALKQQELVDIFPDCQYWVGSVFVEESFRGTQIASALTLQIEQIASDMGLPHLYLQTISRQGGLYAKLGWQSLQEFTHMGEDALLMLKRLQSRRWK